MANVHRAYVIETDAYWVRVEGSGDAPTKFHGVNSDKDSYAELRRLIAIEQKKDPKSKMMDHASLL